MGSNGFQSALYTRGRHLVLGSYYRLIQWNYERELLARTHRTVGGRVKTYELYNRHGRDRMLQAIESLCSDESTVIDVGANVGIYSLALAADAPNRHIVAVEPVPDVIEQLVTNIELNGFDDRIEVKQCCLGAETTDVEFYVSTYTELSSRTAEGAERWEATVTGTETVHQKRLDEIVEETNPPDIVKIDVEGAAAEVLAGGRHTLETIQPIVVLEPHTEELSSDEPAAARSILEAYGYNIDEHGTFWVAKPQRHHNNHC